MASPSKVVGSPRDWRARASRKASATLVPKLPFAGLSRNQRTRLLVAARDIATVSQRFGSNPSPSTEVRASARSFSQDRRAHRERRHADRARSASLRDDGFMIVRCGSQILITGFTPNFPPRSMFRSTNHDALQRGSCGFRFGLPGSHECRRRPLNRY